MYPSQIEFLKHILDECNYLLKEYAQNSYDDFLADERLAKAVCRSLEIIGEASAKIEPDLKLNFPEVAWRAMSDLRNRIIHHYFGIDYDIVWNCVENDIPELKVQIEKMIRQES